MNKKVFRISSQSGKGALLVGLYLQTNGFVFIAFSVQIIANIWPIKEERRLLLASSSQRKRLSLLINFEHSHGFVHTHPFTCM